MVLFDLGGVLVEINGLPEMHAWTGHRYSDKQFWEMWLKSPVVRTFETGRSTPEQFARAIIGEMGLSVGLREFLRSFIRWPTRLYPGTPELLAALGKQYRTACFSNSNALHWPIIMKEMGIEKMFDTHFASHLMGRLKPDPDAFEFVLQTLDCRASAVLFVDDNELNVKSARALGMNAYRVGGPQGVADLFGAFIDRIEF